MASKTLGVFIILIFIALATALTFQWLEMEAYGLPVTLEERFFPSDAGAVMEEAPAETSSADDVE